MVSGFFFYPLVYWHWVISKLYQINCFPKHVMDLTLDIHVISNAKRASDVLLVRKFTHYITNSGVLKRNMLNVWMMISIISNQLFCWQCNSFRLIIKQDNTCALVFNTCIVLSKTYTLIQSLNSNCFKILQFILKLWICYKDKYQSNMYKWNSYQKYAHVE